MGEEQAHNTPKTPKHEKARFTFAPYLWSGCPPRSTGLWERCLTGTLSSALPPTSTSDDSRLCKIFKRKVAKSRKTFLRQLLTCSGRRSTWTDLKAAVGKMMNLSS